MSFDSRNVRDDIEQKNDDAAAAYYRRDTHFNSSVSYTSSLVVHLRQVQTDLRSQHQHEKHTLTELNERLRLFVNRVQQLESHNAKYIAQVADLQRQHPNISTSKSEWSQHYLGLQSDLATLSGTRFDYEMEVELFQLQMGIYQQLIGVEQKWKDEQRSKLEQELSQSSSALIDLRASYAELERKVGSFYAERQDIFQHYRKVSHDWCQSKKQANEWNLGVQMLKNQIVFYKNLHSYSAHGSESLTIDSFDDKQFWALTLDNSIKKIRHDFEQLYAAVYREMAAYYKTKVNEVQEEVEHAVPDQQIEIDELARRQHTLQIEYDEVQKSYSYEKEMQSKLEATYAKLESEFQSIQHQNVKRYDAQSEDLQSLQESIMTGAYDIEEMRQRKINLESELIIYRNLLDSNGIQEQAMIVSPPSLADTTTAKFFVKSQKKRSIGIKECAPDGIYITLMNYSKTKDIHISRWVLKRRIDSKMEILYTLPDRILLEPGNELRIYSKLGAAHKSSSKQRVGASSSLQELVNNDVASWGMGDTVETFLYNEMVQKKQHTFTVDFTGKKHYIDK